MRVNICIKKLGKNRPGTETVFYEYPDTVKTVRDLLQETVRLNLQEYNKGKHETDLLSVLSRGEQEEQAKSGKITFGLHYNNAKPDFGKAVENAWQCFEDGMAVLFVDGEKMEELDAPVCLHEGSELTFVRMTLLAGRMW